MEAAMIFFFVFVFEQCIFMGECYYRELIYRLEMLWWSFRYPSQKKSVPRLYVI